jgi:RNA polymerase sigma factor (sigma-70 family)
MADQIDTEVLYTKYSSMVRNLANQYEDDWQQQEDLEHDCWVRILEQLPNFDHTKSKIGTFIHTIAESACLDYTKSENRFKRQVIVYEHELGATEIDFDGDYSDEPLDVRCVTDTLLDLSDGLAWLKATEITEDLDKILSVNQKRCLMLSAEGYDSNEIAEELGLSASAVRTHIERAREKAREYLEE